MQNVCVSVKSLVSEIVLGYSISVSLGQGFYKYFKWLDVCFYVVNDVYCNGTAVFEHYRITSIKTDAAIYVRET